MQLSLRYILLPTSAPVYNVQYQLPSCRAAKLAVVPHAGVARQRHLDIQFQAHPPQILPFAVSVVFVIKSERCLYFYTYMHNLTYANQGMHSSNSAQCSVAAAEPSPLLPQHQGLPDGRCRQD